LLSSLSTPCARARVRCTEQPELTLVARQILKRLKKESALDECNKKAQMSSGALVKQNIYIGRPSAVDWRGPEGPESAAITPNGPFSDPTFSRESFPRSSLARVGRPLFGSSGRGPAAAPCAGR